MVIERAGGTFLVSYGLIVKSHRVEFISDFEDARDYVIVAGKVMLGGAKSDIEKANCYTGAEA